MNSIMLLDCTLRDGGYVNNWQFGKRNIEMIVSKTIQAGVEIIECGYLSLKNAGSLDVARFNSLNDVSRAYAKSKNPLQNYAVMVNYGEFPAKFLGQADKNSPIIRVAFHRKDMDAAFEYFEELRQRGYRYYIQPMGALNYTDEEYMHLIDRVNHTGGEAFYIVDSFGVMELRDFRRLLFLADNNLASNISLGYHSHNNLQQAYSNSKYMVEQNLEHDLIIDASIFGMGRGAGNLNIELFANYLNKSYGKNYNIELFLEAFDECLKPIFVDNFWGYSLPFYLSSIHNCHPNYANYFAEKNTLSVKSMHEVLAMITEEDRGSFSQEKASRYYQAYQENFIDDTMTKKIIMEAVSDRDVLILASGKSLHNDREKIESYIDARKPVIFGVHKVSSYYMYDYLFIVNEKRIPDGKPWNVREMILTSNIPCNTCNLKVNYASYLCEEEKISDNPTLMLINLLTAIGVHSISLAGFDGFSANSEDNYFEERMSLGSNAVSKMNKNRLIMQQVKKIMERVELNFITPSLYVT